MESSLIRKIDTVNHFLFDEKLKNTKKNLGCILFVKVKKMKKKKHEDITILRRKIYR
jgi:hypothetical protein